jgi:hypothetical protein
MTLVFYAFLDVSLYVQEVCLVLILQTDVAILDFSKAFDTVPHKKILSKMDSYGIRGPINNWLNMFLTHRKMKAVVENS